MLQLGLVTDTRSSQNKNLVYDVFSLSFLQQLVSRFCSLTTSLIQVCQNYAKKTVHTIHGMYDLKNHDTVLGSEKIDDW